MLSNVVKTLRVSRTRPAMRLSFPTLPSRFYVAGAAKAPLCDRDIPYEMVRVVEGNNPPGPPTPLSEVLSSLVRLVEFKNKTREKPVATAELVRPPSDELGGYALVRIRPIQNSREILRQKKERQIEIRRYHTEKEVQISFTAAPSDVAHKLRKVRDEVEHGHRVVLAVMSKAGQQEIPSSERNIIISGWIKQLEDVAKEWSPRRHEKTFTAINLQHKDREIPQNSLALLRKSFQDPANQI